MLFITGNKGKFEEAKRILPGLEQSDIDLPEIQSIYSTEIIKNKLEAAKKEVDGDIVVEDNSLVLDCLDGLPGPLIKWFLKTIGNEGLVKITDAFGNNKAKAKVVIGYSSGKGEIKFFKGIIKGKIVSPRGDRGFGWDPIFLPDRFDKTFGEMDLEEKNEISMRKIAFQKLREYLEQKKDERDN